MKIILLNTSRSRNALAALVAGGLMLGSSQAAQIGINFQDEWGGDGGTAVTMDAFGVPAANWFNMPRIYNSNSQGPVSSNATINLPGGGALLVEWSCVNTWSLYANQPTSGPGEDQVIYGYLDDTGVGYRVRISGFRNSLASYTITTIAATDGGSSFADSSVAYGSDTNLLQYLNNYIPAYAGGLAGTSTVSSVISTLDNNNAVVITGQPKADSQNRSTLAGIIISYTAGNVPPLIETQPTAPTGPIFSGDSFQLTALASGAPTLSYQWRKDGVAIDGATTTAFAKIGATTADTGDYDVVVTNSLGAVTSAVAQVTITAVTQPTITRGPRSESVYAGYPVTLSVEATGGALSYQWKKGDTAIADATNALLTLSSFSADAAATYTVEVSNPVGPTATAAATLTLKTPTSTYEAAVAQTKPLLWYRFGETSILADSAANSGSLGAAGNGAYVGNVDHGVAGALAGSSATAASFTGGKVSVPYNASLNPNGPFTVECWIKPDATGTGLIVQSMINGENPANSNDRNGWALRQNNLGLRFLVGTDLGAPFYYYYTTADGLLAAGAWQHVAVVYDGTAPSIYINGVLAPTTVTRQDGVDITPAEIALIRIVPNTAAPLIVGDRGYGGWTFSGSVDELAVFGSALTANQLAAHYQNGQDANRTTPYATLITSDGALEYLRFDEPPYPGSAANSGTLGSAFNGKHTGVDIHLNQAGPRPPEQPGLEADNVAVSMTNGFVSAPLCTNLNVNTLTVAGWLKPQEIPSGSDLGFPCWLGDGGMHIENSSGRPTRELRYHWKGGQWGWGSGLVAPADIWSFVAMVVTPTNATFYLSDGTTLKSSVNIATHAALAVSSPLGFGGNQPGRSDRTYRGGLDEFAVYDRALTQSEINTLFLVGTGAKLELTLSPGGVIEDTKPSGTLHHGYNHGATWVDSNTDIFMRTRTGVEQFSAATGSQITIPADPDLEPSSGTIMFWMRANAPLPPPGNEGAILFDHRTGSGTVIVLHDDGSVFFQTAPGTANSFSAGYLPDDVWHHVAVVYDQSAAGSVTIYVDGYLQVSNPNQSAWSWPADQQIELGRSHDTYWRRFDGYMDDFRIYNRALTDAEIGQVYANDDLVDTSALKVRFNFSTAGIGQSVSWPFGTLESSPAIGPDATWTPVPGATSPYPFLSTEPSLFFRGSLQ